MEPLKKDRRADVNTGLFMEESNTWAVVWMHTIRSSVSLGQTEGGKEVMSVCVCLCNEGLFTCFTGQSSGCAGTTVCLWQTHAVFKHC